jgi:hypothetical protein
MGTAAGKSVALSLSGFQHPGELLEICACAGDSRSIAAPENASGSTNRQNRAKPVCGELLILGRLVIRLAQVGAKLQCFQDTRNYEQAQACISSSSRDLLYTALIGRVKKGNSG